MLPPRNAEILITPDEREEHSGLAGPLTLSGTRGGRGIAQGGSAPAPHFTGIPCRSTCA